MMRSMYSGVAGLNTHQTKMNVIGNNIANVNTIAYKSQSVTFSELMYQTTQSASGGNAVTGRAGINARQIGLGTKVGAINTSSTTQGASQATNNPFDIRITGDQFFIVSNGIDNFFTRDGSFYIDGLGNLATTSNGYNVMGWQVDLETMDIKKDTVSPLRIMSSDNIVYPPEATTSATVTGIIDKNDANVNSSSGKTMNLMFYDNLGYSYTAKFNLKATGEEGVYLLGLNSILDANNDVVEGSSGIFKGTASNVRVKNARFNLVSADYSFGDDYKLRYKGEVVATMPSWSEGYILKEPDLSVFAKAYGMTSEEFRSVRYEVVDPHGHGTFDIWMEEYIRNDPWENNPDGSVSLWTRDLVDQESTVVTRSYTGAVAVKYDPATGKFISVDGDDSIMLELSGLEPAGRFKDISVNFRETAMYNNSGVSTINVSSGDSNKLGAGRKLGQMTGIAIQDDGRIYASYDNGMSRLLGQMAVAEFANASGLEKQGDNLYKNTQNSGEFDGIGIDIKSGGGYMTTGVLEMSNVDLSAEFTEMITTQRGFQANSRIITVSDTLLEELVNLKR